MSAAVVPPILATLYSLRKGSLSRSGIAASWIVGPVTGWASHRLCCHLYSFFFLSSSITRVGEHVKRRLEGANFKKGGARTATQVFCNGGFQSLIAALYIVLLGGGRDRLLRLTTRGKKSQNYPRCEIHMLPPPKSWAFTLTAAHLSGYACAAGDTWASELGVLSKSAPRLITAPWRTVPRGTNGGVSLLGTVASAAGGASVGITHILFELLAFMYHEFHAPSNGDSLFDRFGSVLSSPTTRRAMFGVIAQSTCAGVFGSFIDSLLGATLQYSGTVRGGVIVNSPRQGSKRIVNNLHLLTNDQVNFAAIALTCLFGGISAHLFHKSRDVKTNRSGAESMAFSRIPKNRDSGEAFL